MHLRSGYEKRRPRVELVPLFDLAFLLLVSFIYATMNMAELHSVEIALPKAQGKAEPADGFRIMLTSDNRILVNGATVELRDAIDAAIAANPDEGRAVIVEGDREADLGTAVELLSGLRQAGVKAVSFLVRKEQ